MDFFNDDDSSKVLKKAIKKTAKHDENISKCIDYIVDTVTEIKERIDRIETMLEEIKDDKLTEIAEVVQENKEALDKISKNK